MFHLQGEDWWYGLTSNNYGRAFCGEFSQSRNVRNGRFKVSRWKGKTIHSYDVDTLQSKDFAVNQWTFQIFKYGLQHELNQKLFTHFTVICSQVVNIEQYGSDLESLANVDASGILLRLPHSLRDFKTLKAIASLPRFNGTIYKTEPRLLKSYMELHLERLHLDDAGATFYYTLTYPVLTKSSLIPTFRVEQTGFIVNGRHMMLDLPNQLALIDGRYHEYDCGQNIFDLCRINTTTIRPSCLQESLTDGLCSMIPSDCGDMCSINTRSGLLLTTNHAIHAFLRRDSKEKQMVTIPPVSMSAHFIPWMNYSSVVVMGNGRVIEPPVGQDYEFNILINSDYVNYTTPIFNNVLSVDESGLAVLQEQIEQQKLTIDNITLHIETVKTGMSNDGDSIWSNLSLYLHLGQTIFLLYLLAQLIMCVRSMKFGSVE